MERHRAPRFNAEGNEIPWIPWEEMKDKDGNPRVRRERPGMKLHGGNERMELERKMKTEECREAFSKLGESPDMPKEFFEAAVHDGRKSCFSPIPLWDHVKDTGKKTHSVVVQLPSTKLEIPGKGPRGPRHLKITFELVNMIPLHVLKEYVKGIPSEQAQTAIQVLDVIFRHDQALVKDVLVGGQGRKFFYPNDNTLPKIDLGQGVEIVKGLFQSVRPAIGKMIVNLDVAQSPFIACGAADAIAFAISGRSLPIGGGRRGGFGGPRGGFGNGNGGSMNRPFDQVEQRYLRKLIGAKVQVVHRPDSKVFTIKGFTCHGSAQTMIDVKDLSAPKGTRKQVSTQAYLRDRYGFDDPHPEVQLVLFKNGTSLPLSALRILPGKAMPPGKLTGEQAANMIRSTAVRPQERKAQVDKVREQMAGYDANPRLKKWGIRVQPRMMEVPARVLVPPTVVYHPQSRQQPNVSSGAWNVLDVKYVVPSRPLQHWAVVNFSRMPLPAVQGFVGKLVSNCIARGMPVVNMTPHIETHDSQKGELETLKFACRAVVKHPDNTTSSPPQLLLIILEDRKAYEDIKRCLFTQFPVPVVSQCLMANKLGNPAKLDQYCNNVTMKLSLKLHGENWTIKNSDLPKWSETTMVMGADCAHPPQTRGIEEPLPSIAVVTGQTKPGSFVYAAQIREQTGRQEIIEHLKEMAQNLILKFQQRSGTDLLPQQILFFRDGCSEGQYAQCLEHEAQAIKEACMAIDERYNPKLTFIICAKAHHFRFFAANPADVARDRTGNLPAGTILDHTITHPIIWSFFLQAHAGLQGTSRPTHYVCLLDENDFGSDEIQKLTNSLCFSYARATRSVSMVPAAYYADAVCTKARALAYGLDDGASVSSAQRGRMAAEGYRRIQDRIDGVGLASSGWEYADAWYM